MKLLRKVNVTSQIFQIFIADSSSTTGAGLTGLVFNSGSLTAYYHRDTDTTATSISLVTMTVGTFTSSGFKEIDSTNMPGWYQFCPPNAALASGAASVGFNIKGATNMAPLPIEVDLDAQVDVTFWNGTVVATPATAGIPDINVKNMNNVAGTSITTINANQGSTQPMNFTGTGASALIKSDMTDIAGSAVSTSTAQLGVNLVNWNGTAATSTVPPDAIFIRSGTAQAGGATTITLDSGASATNNLYDNEIIFIRSGTGAGQSNIIASYVGSTKVATVSNSWATNPDATSVFSIIAPGPVIASVSGTVTANVTQWLGNAVTATASGIPDVNTKNINNVSASSVTTINANQGTTQPVNFTGTSASALVKSDMTDIAGAAVSTSTAQVGVNIVNIAGAAAALDANNLLKVDTEDWKGGIIPAPNVTGVPKADVIDWLGTAPLALSSQQVQAVVPSSTVVASVSGAVGSVTGNVGGNVTGSVGSVVGAVGSVTGNIGGNVTGSVGSVAGAVGSVTGNVGGNVTGSVGSVTSPVSIASGQLFIKKNTAFTLTFPMTDSTTHAPKTGLTVASSRSIDGAPLAATANSVSELSAGLYNLSVAGSDVNGTMITFEFTATGADTKFIGVVTQS